MGNKDYLLIMQSFKAVYVNPSRRDLLKQLVAIGAVGTCGILNSPLAAADNSKINKTALGLDSTWREDPRYEDLRKTMLFRFNKPERYPDVISHARSEQEIIEALKFAAENDMQVVCRGSGHNKAGAVLRNGGMLLDVSGLNKVTVNAQEKTASVQPGVLMVQLYHTLAEHNLAFPTAFCHTVALGGYLLGGGFGTNGSHWGHGPACYSVLDADVILADGRKLTVSKDNYADLYWTIRGVGPGFFGIVTRFTLKLYDHPGVILSNNYLHPVDALPEINNLIDGLQDKKDERVSISSSVFPAKDSAGRLVANVSITAFADPGDDPLEEARSLLAPYQEKGIANGALSMDEYRNLLPVHMMFTPSRNERANSDNIFTDDPAALLAILDHARKRPPNSSMYIIFSYDQQMFPFRQDACYSAAGRHWLSSRLNWHDANEDAANNKWLQGFNDILKPSALSHYINEIDNENNPQRVRNCFSEDNWLRLAKVRNKYDPEKRFYSYLGWA